MIVIGIDPSLTGTGLCRLTDGKLLDKVKDVYIVKTKPEGKHLKERMKRFREIVSQIETFCCLNKDIFTLFVIESYAFGAKGQTFTLGESGGLLRDWLLKTQDQFKTDTIEVGPGQLKKFITGKGNCEKDLMLKEVYKFYGADFNNNNICDAFGLAAIGYFIHCVKERLPIKLISYQKEVINKILEGNETYFKDSKKG